MERVCFFRPGPVVVGDGRTCAEVFTLRELMPSVKYPAHVVEAFVIWHAGQNPREGQPTRHSPLLVSTPIGGFYTVSLAKPEGTTMLVAGLHRDLHARWVHQPPTVIVSDEETISVNWSFQAYVRHNWSFRLRQYRWHPITLQPDWGLCIAK